MITWPQQITIVDDTPVANELKKLLDDLSWVADPRHFFAGTRLLESEMEQVIEEVESLPEAVQHLSTDFFKTRTVPMHITDAASVEDAIKQLQKHKDGPAIAFIDFNHDNAKGGYDDLIARYHKIPEDDVWRIRRADADPRQQGGCVFCRAFQPRLEPQLRLLCPSSLGPPRELKAVTSGATTEPCSLWQGLPDWIHAIVVVLTKWVEIQEGAGDPFENLLTLVSSAGGEDVHEPNPPSGGLVVSDIEEAIRKLLKLNNVEELRAVFTGDLSEALRNALKTLTPATGERLSAGAAWLLALGAFRQHNHDADWRQVFSTDDLLKDAVSKNYFRKKPLVPPQQTHRVFAEVGGGPSPQTQTRTVRRFYVMCCELFKAEGGDTVGPLQRVELSLDRGLRFNLNIPYEAVRENFIVFWDQACTGELPDDHHFGTLSIWRFWLASAVGDKESPLNPALFVADKWWKMNICPNGPTGTEIVFHA